jgi:hypothetical protein
MSTDAALLAAARTDARAFRALYDRYADRSYGFHLSLAGRPMRRTTSRGGARPGAPRARDLPSEPSSTERKPMNDSSPPVELGDALEGAAAADLEAGRRPGRRVLPRLVLVAAVLAIVVPGVAISATQLIGNDEVARSLPAGTLSLAGTEPTCTTVVQDEEYHCVLARAPRPEVSDWKGTVEPTVDASKHVDGGCRSLASDGREWECYIGRAAVAQRIIAEGLLGEYAPSPGVG